MVTEEDIKLAVDSVTSFYQSKRAQLKKQVTHYLGKFTMVKNENNVLRKMNRRQTLIIQEYMELYGQLHPEVLKSLQNKKVGEIKPVYKTAVDA